MRWNSTLLDHRQIATKQQLFTTHPMSPGSPLFLPHGTRIFNTLLAYMRKVQRKYGYDEVVSPILYKKDLWVQSGHWDNFRDEMFHTGEFSLKPMNCPGHCLIYQSLDRSYRELPIKLSDFSPLHRNEATGGLSGLTRVRRFHQDDGHIFCMRDQIEQQISESLNMMVQVYNKFGFTDYKLMLSTRPEKYIGDIESWDKAEQALTNALNEMNHPWTINEADGAFYGPKIDVMLVDAHGKSHQTATLQLDFQLPQRFELEYRGAAQSLERPVMIHRAVFGSVERFMALLIENYQGNWPFWLSPRQLAILPVSELQVSYANSIKDYIAANDFFVDIDDSAESVSRRVRHAISMGYNYIAVVGDKEMNDGTVSIRTREARQENKLTKEQLLTLFNKKASE
ncbi:hypothetical protein CANCADRAFT_24071 [Tortispora caseinolytica NRRL Y-17796]|uniref:threonine--tRNA ligase n=1 Tax=Tortispora caseinolytica NRRL Y-17796 TaxID=767744 RepID=A0A1E4TEK5_9ASCO|nr:hypothetical protein CANCADRAFT_24071 [Tortispora caseinolytica NRRL Y-17796]